MPSKNRNVTAYAFHDAVPGRYVGFHQALSSNSQRTKDGKINLAVQNPHSNLKIANHIRASGDSYAIGSLYLGGQSTTATYRLIPDAMLKVDSVTQVALARYLGRKRKGQASLGVTFGSWKQSLAMIITRLRTVLWWLKLLAHKIKERARKRQSLAGAYLEEIFGWAPLIGDIRAAFAIIAKDTAPPSFVRGAHSGAFKNTQGWRYPGPVGMYNVSQSMTGDVRVTIVGQYAVTNPNKFLLNQLGLLNPAVVIWDLIPWSFLVGMFVNIQSMLASMTDNVGLSLQSESTTTTVNWNYTLTRGYQDRANRIAIGSRVEKGMEKQRSTSLPSQTLQFRIPDIGLGTAVMLASLVVQKMKKLDRYLSI